MAPEYVSQTAVPSVALTSEDFGRLRHFGPGHRVWNERDLSRPSLFVGQPLEAQYQLHILADGVVQIAAGGDDCFALKQAERSGDDDVPAESVPAEPAEQECAQILDHLNAGEQAGRHSGPYHPAVLHLRSVDNANCPAGGDDIGG